MFFNSTDLDLLHARPGSFTITPTPGMVDALSRDYRAMAGMVFGEVPDFAEVLDATRQLEQVINQGNVTDKEGLWAKNAGCNTNRGSGTEQ